MVYKFFDAKSTDSADHTGTRYIHADQQLTNKLHRPINTKFKTRKVYSSYQENIGVADPADMQLISKYRKILAIYVIDIYSK